jgi:hypothetical protein
MSAHKSKPTRWSYILALFIPIFACLGTALVVFRNVPKLPGALESLSVKKLTQVVVPGSAEIHIPESGAYAVYYEYRSVVDGVTYSREEIPPRLRCQLISASTGKALMLAQSNVKGDVYVYPERAGVMFKRVDIDQPGIYNFSCRYANGRSYPKNVMAVGPNLVLEFFNAARKPIAAMLFGSFAFLLSGVISALIIAFVAIKRYRSKNLLAS